MDDIKFMRGLLGIMDFNILLPLFILSAAAWNYYRLQRSIQRDPPVIYSMADGDENPTTSQQVSPTLQAPHTLSTIKLPILKKGTNGQIRVLPPKTTEEILARERERKGRTTLLMAIPEDHLAKFHKMTDAKEMWEAIKSKFKGLHKGYDRFQSHLSQLEIHDACVSTEDASHKFLRVFEFYVKGSTTSSSSTQNVASTNEARENGKRLAKQDEHKAMVTIDGEGVDWTDHVKDDTDDYALMAFNSSNSGSDTKEKLGDASIEKIKPKNYLDDYLLNTPKIMFEKSNVEASVWKDQKGRYGLAKVKSWKLIESCGVYYITFLTTQMFLLVERMYPLTHFTLEQMLNDVRLYEYS
nr:xylulose kinase-1 [Tanacetum cinerariifolium]